MSWEKNMLKNISIKNFKCFKNQEINLSKGTMLLGMNSGGKSTVLQALLLSILAKNKKEVNLISNEYNLNLNSFNEIINRNSDDIADDIIISLESTDDKVSCFKFKETDHQHIVDVSIENDENSDIKIDYLSANRYITRQQIAGSTSTWYRGQDNEHLAFIIESALKLGGIKTFKERNYIQKEKTKKIDFQINEWLSYILPNNSVQTASSSIDNHYVLRFDNNGKTVSQENIGFGISFILPIIVSALTAPINSIVIIENPELHLHPKAQSNLGVFLAAMASSGVQIIAETHSDHIVNGFRKSILYSEHNIQANDLLLNNFESYSVNPISVDEDANLLEWPKGFLDQFEDDLFEMRKMRIEND